MSSGPRVFTIPKETLESEARLKEVLSGGEAPEVAQLLRFLELTYKQPQLLQFYASPRIPNPKQSVEEFRCRHLKAINLLLQIEAVKHGMESRVYVNNMIALTSLDLSRNKMELFLALRIAAKYILYSVYDTRVF